MTAASKLPADRPEAIPPEFPRRPAGMSDAAYARYAASIRRRVAAAPPLTADQRAIIAALLGGPKRDAA